MPFSIHVEADTGVAIGTCTGVLGLDDAKAAALELWGNAAWKRRAVVWDFRNARLDAVSDDISTFARFVTEKQPLPGPSRVAMVTASDVDFGQARVYEALRERPPTEVRVFRDFEAAVAWARAAVV
ncbi:MAG TPA: hypothetical protein VMR65_06880 [Candidatus Sulfotelmatobacter sp.]|jgi:hypothetical protein|nr:hypothetical protein [Candidatus Sulfotelmatobacter sp.]